MEDFDGAGDVTYSAWGYRNDTTAFCCYVDDDTTQNVDTVSVTTDDGNDVVNLRYSTTSITSADCVVSTEDGSDRIYGSDRNNCGGATSCWDDQLYPGDGPDIVYGYGGQDRIQGDSNLTCVDNGTLDDFIDGGQQNDTIEAGCGRDDVYGGAGDDAIWGEDHNDYIDGQGGSDAIYAGGGDDTVDGGALDDYISGGDGADTLDGELGDDDIDGDDGDDTIYGSDGDDIIHGNAGNDILYGGTGADVLCGGYTTGKGTNYFHAVEPGVIEFVNDIDWLWQPTAANAPTGAGASTGDECGHSGHGSGWAGAACDYSNTTRPTECN